MNILVTTRIFTPLRSRLCWCMQTGSTALHLAAGGGHLAVVKLLLDHAADVNVTTDVNFLSKCMLNMHAVGIQV